MKALVVTVLLLLSSTLAASREHSSFSNLSFLPFLCSALVDFVILSPSASFLLFPEFGLLGVCARARKPRGFSFIILPSRHGKLFYCFVCSDIPGSVFRACVFQLCFNARSF